MPKTTLIRPLDQQWQWLTASDNQAVVRQGNVTEMAAALDKQQDDRVVLLLPGEAVFLTQASVPTRNRRQLLQALPYAIEEQLAADPEHLLIVPGESDAKGRVAVAVTEKTSLRKYLSGLADVNIDPDHVTTDVLCLPQQTPQPVLVQDGRRFLLRLGPQAGMVMDADWLEEGLKNLTAELGGPAPELTAMVDEQPLALCRRLGFKLSEESPAPELLVLINQHLDKLPINLLQGEFLRAGTDQGWRRWRLPAALGLLAILFAAAIATIDLARKQNQSEALKQAIEQQFRNSFPHVQRVTADPLSQARQELDRLQQAAAGGESDFLYLLNHVAPQIQAVDELRLTGLRFRNGRLQLDLAANRIDSLEQVQLAAQAGGISAELESANLDEAGVTGVLNLIRTKP